jgi:hypothetical protein
MQTQNPRQASAKQLRYLRLLAEQTGTTFTPPASAQEASRAIEEMRGRRRTSRGEIARERGAVSRDMATRRGDAAQVRAQEVSGYGAHAAWADPPEEGPRVPTQGGAAERAPARSQRQARSVGDGPTLE